jgi:glycosyltransferase involved in cell wall biosynthesis
MFVFNDARHDVRVLREAASLRRAGHEVTIMARAADVTDPHDEREVVDGVEIVRVGVPARRRLAWVWLVAPWRLRDPWRVAMREAIRGARPSLTQLLGLLAIGAISVPWIAVRWPIHVLRRRTGPRGRSSADWLAWWHLVVLGWAARAASEAPAGGVRYGHDLSGLEAAGRAATGGSLIYDSHEIFTEAGSIALRPRIVKWWLRRSERRWTRRAAALVTVNDALAAELGRRLGPDRVVVVHNAPPRWDPPTPPPDLIRAVTGIPRDAPIALYHGGFSAHRGLEELADAILEPGLEDVHAVYLGYGSLRSTLDGLAAEDRFGGRLHVLDAVAPDVLEAWVASADVGVVAIQPSTLNHRLSTPNKLFESIASGLPVVVTDLPEMRRIVMDDPLGPLGEVCRPNDPKDLARAIRAIVARPIEEREELRRRCLAAAHARWNWETEVEGLLELVADVGA